MVKLIKAMQFAKIFGKNYFIPGIGWLQSLKYRHAIVFKFVSGESSQIDTSVIEEWLRSNENSIK